jgi:hypothetical protein
MSRAPDSPFETTAEADRIGIAIGARLEQGIAHLPDRVTNRLYQARLAALAARKHQAAPLFERAQRPALAFNQGGQFGNSSSNWSRLSWMAPFVVLALGLLAIAEWQQDARINDIAAVDIALLSDDVPPDAYMDSGFLAFLKLSNHAKRELETHDADKTSTAVDPS